MSIAKHRAAKLAVTPANASSFCLAPAGGNNSSKGFAK
jgi:hypothetical protein